MVRKIEVLLVFVLVHTLTFAQHYSCSGRVYDSNTKEALAFVNIVANNSKTGTSSDIDGKFTVISNEKIDSLKFSYVGYQSRTVHIEGKLKNLKVFLDETPVELEEVLIVAGENPAHRIIKNVIANRDNNDPEKLRSFSYTSYDKMIFTIDTVNLPRKVMEEPDSLTIQLKKFLSDKDFFMLETVSERRFMAPDRNHEKVVASRISGLKDPVFLFLSSQMQSPSFYKETIEILGHVYINPISRGSIRKYYFQLEDTTYTAAGDTVFIISYRPRLKTNFDGLKGVLSVNTNGWAIQNVIAEPSRQEGDLTIRIQQKYRFVQNKHWFPVQMNTDIVFHNIKVNNYSPIGKGYSYIRDIELNPELVKRQFNQITIEVEPDAGKMPETFWVKYRGDSLSQREKRTYEFVDSVGMAEHFDRMAETVKTMMSGRLPLGYFDINLRKIARYNDYEGFYLGLGLMTSKKLSRVFSVGGFWGYGFRDKTAKYGVNLEVILEKYREVKLRFEYFDDITETGGVQYSGHDKSLLNPENFRNFMIKGMDPTERIDAGLSFRALRWTIFNLGFRVDNKRAMNGYLFGDPSGNGNDTILAGTFHFTEASAGFRLAFKEKFLQMPDMRMSLGTRYPVIRFNYTRGISGVLDGAYDYNKFDLKIQKTFFFKYLGQSLFDVRAGLVDRAIPQSNLYNGRGSYRIFTLFAEHSFATQRMNEFLSDRYVYLFYTHQFGKLLWRSRKFSPEFTVATNVGFGWLRHPEYHHNIAFNIMDKGYFESGIQINNMLNMMGFYTLGLAVYYRYGAYHLPKTGDNFAYKFTLNFPF